MIGLDDITQLTDDQFRQLLKTNEALAKNVFLSYLQDQPDTQGLIFTNLMNVTGLIKMG